MADASIAVAASGVLRSQGLDLPNDSRPYCGHFRWKLRADATLARYRETVAFIEKRENLESGGQTHRTRSAGTDRWPK